VREALFSMLGDIHGTTVCDVYAGSGALGFEALSRGASSVLFVESDRRAARSLRENIAALDVADRAQVLAAKVERSRRRILSYGPFDLLLADPPYRTGALAHLFRLADSTEVLMPGGLFVVESHVSESPADDEIRDDYLATVRRRRYGATAITILRSERRDG
jgi:16S rRNA (guanine966-N2)-methyltransferase